MLRNLQIANKTYVRNENRVGNGNIINIRILAFVKHVRT